MTTNSLNKMAWSKLIADRPSLFALLFILSCTFIGFFSYLFIPDKSPYANQMHLELATLPPLSKIDFIQIPNNTQSSESFFEYFFKGKKPSYEKIPIASHKELDEGINYIKTGSDLTKNYQGDYTLLNQTFWFGTDRFGRDLLSRMIYGIRVSLAVGLIAVFISLLIGISLGLLAGFYRGRVDNIIMWFVNVIWSIPTLLLVIAITLALGKGFWQVFVAVGLTMWVEVARIVRGQVLAIRELEYIDASKVLAYSSYRIIFKHILPNVIGPVIVISAANFAAAILIEAGLSFLGIGAQPPIPTWGGIIKDHYSYIIMDKAYLAIIPGLAIMSLVLSFMILGNGLRDAFDVRH
ncbi:MAG: ABC transporter permease [Flavobacteriales bacterium]|jgi:peptide/nickel transport system permease protein|nr:ABC transporter permease [Flavobacteriales bacterium]